MTYLRDGDPFTFPYGGKPQPNVRAVGWLTKSESFTRGDVSDAFLDRAIWICRWPVNLTRGLHRCPFCPREEAALGIGGAWVRAPFGDFVTGHGEIRVTGIEDTTYAAPDMLVHYIQTHGYRPPDEFIAAVLAMPADRVPLSESSGTWLALDHGQWVIGGRQSEPHPIAEAMVGVLPLLERDPSDVLPAMKHLHGPDFPMLDLLTVALNTGSGYWQGHAVKWLAAIDLSPTGAIASAARGALQRKQAQQRDRQQLQRWLEGKPIRDATPASRVVLQCNLLGTRGQAPRAYVGHPNLGNVAERIEVLVRHKRGAWAAFWVPIEQLGDFRVKTLPPEHPRFHDRRILDYPTRDDAQHVVELLQAAHDRRSADDS